MGEIGEGAILEADGIIDLQTGYTGIILILLLFSQGSGLLLTGKKVLIEDAILVFGMLALPLSRSLANGFLKALFLVGQVLILIECLFGLLLELPWSRFHSGQLLSGPRFVLIEVVEEVEAISKVLSWNEIIISRVSASKFVLD